jgi:hypothetical protein
MDVRFRILADTMDVVLGSLKMNRKFHANLKIDTWPRQNDMVTETLIEQVQFCVKEDLYRQAVMKLKEHGPRKYVSKPYAPPSLSLYYLRSYGYRKRLTISSFHFFLQHP